MVPARIDMAEEEPVNPQQEVEESCKPQCVKAWLEYQASLFCAAKWPPATSDWLSRRFEQA